MSSPLIQEGYCAADLNEAADGNRPTQKVRTCPLRPDQQCPLAFAAASARRDHPSISPKQIVENLRRQGIRLVDTGCIRRP